MGTEIERALPEVAMPMGRRLGLRRVRVVVDEVRLGPTKVETEQLDPIRDSVEMDPTIDEKPIEIMGLSGILDKR